VLAKGKAPLTFHFPEASAGFHWALVPDVEIHTQWWAGLTPPFQAYAQPNMEQRIMCFSTETSIMVREFRQFDYPLNVSKISATGLRFKVSDYDPLKGTPELWCLASMTRRL
jgi:hypothetical protein